MLIKNLFKGKQKLVSDNINPVKQNCLTCKFNEEGLHCKVGSYLAEQGKTGVCYEGELWESKENQNHDKAAI